MTGSAVVRNETFRIAILSALLLFGAVAVWQLASTPSVGGRTQGLPGPAAVATVSWEMLSEPFYDRGPNDKGIGLQVLSSLGRVAIGYGAASVAAGSGFFARKARRNGPIIIISAQPRPTAGKPYRPIVWPK